MYLDANGNIIPGKSMTGIFSVGVPGTVAGMQEMHDKLGYLPWAELVKPAVDLASNGLLLTEKEARGLNRQRTEFLKENPGKTYLLSTEGKEWKQGDLLVQSDLAETLERIMTKKANGFYKGKTARFIVKEMQAQNGLISKKDLKNYQAVWRAPIKSKYKNYQIIGMPPPSSGGVALAQLLQMVEPYSLNKWGPTSDSTIQVMVEAERRVYADRSKWLGDPDFVKVPVTELIDPAYNATRMSSMNFAQATPS
jgi:gamma-glutamyltranspeptidase/glutathione hydrolase